LPLSAASCRGVAPSRFVALTFAPARISTSAVSRSFSRTAQCSAVVPSTCGALTSAFCRRSDRTASRFCFSAASAIGLVAAPALTAASSVITDATTTRWIDIGFFSRATDILEHRSRSTVDFLLAFPLMRSITCLAIVVASAAPAFAHHGGGTFDLSKSVTYNGTLTKVELVNPHSWLYFDVKEADGKVTHHRCEMR